jgi:hypothetical protein
VVICQSLLSLDSPLYSQYAWDSATGVQYRKRKYNGYDKTVHDILGEELWPGNTEEPPEKRPKTLYYLSVVKRFKNILCLSNHLSSSIYSLINPYGILLIMQLAG